MILLIGKRVAPVERRRGILADTAGQGPFNRSYRREIRFGGQ
jgi:hypothetical protein